METVLQHDYSLISSNPQSQWENSWLYLIKTTKVLLIILLRIKFPKHSFKYHQRAITTYSNGQLTFLCHETKYVYCHIELQMSLKATFCVLQDRHTRTWIQCNLRIKILRLWHCGLKYRTALRPNLIRRLPMTFGSNKCQMHWLISCSSDCWGWPLSSSPGWSWASK